MRTIVSTPPTGLPMGGGVCVLRRWKRVAETSSLILWRCQAGLSRMEREERSGG